jgi:hypothetical protein
MVKHKIKTILYFFGRYFSSKSEQNRVLPLIVDAVQLPRTPTTGSMAAPPLNPMGTILKKKIKKKGREEGEIRGDERV